MSALGCDPEVAAEFLRALAHPMRLRILCRLLDGELAVAGFESELGLRQPNLSQQLAALREAGLVTTRRESKSIIYSLADPRVAAVLEALRAAIGGPPPAPRERAPVPAPTPAEPPRATGEAGLFAVTGWGLPR
ncbi:ArsR/SmtB family transcription factor [Sediminicoccus rosea]|jgi:DNA-binding transcriptional ArsR family regulator|uniref:Metalloregulator ArsR/SmtB family transcription factor n=1 Tax=Sediminicoccus rosea TaxID=1225128 RepID=A0ABZ0PKS5_9PROT|nr:metalloregulator ArsR/SmtB family transcription factor [Sediminicoccus rosea]WPB86062.1 metalloregulator ArsR/SmtB family transcription factor [Sediminicoccus rosea]